MEDTHPRSEPTGPSPGPGPDGRIGGEEADKEKERRIETTSAHTLEAMRKDSPRASPNAEAERETAPSVKMRKLPEDMEPEKKRPRPRWVFWELFAGFCGLSLAISAAMAGAAIVIEPLDAYRGDDLLQDETFNKTTRKCRMDNVTWLHMAPPCRTFTKARRSDKHGTVKTLRTLERPEGDPNSQETVEANLLASRCAMLAIQQWKSRQFFSIENPWESFLWELKLMKKVRALPGTKLVYLDQCAYGSQHMKPTGVLTNAPWLFEGDTCAKARPHDHVVLEGKVWSYKSEAWVWYTSEAAEYPAGLCEAWAKHWKDWTGAQEEKPPHKMRLLGKHKNMLVATPDTVLTPRQEPKPIKSKKEIREEENEDAIGGMRNPNRAISRSAAWRRIGSKLRSVLDESLDQCMDHPVYQLLRKLRKKESVDSPDFQKYLEDMGEATASKMAQALDLPDAMEKGPSGWRWRLIQAITIEADDPDIDVAMWLAGDTPLGIDKPILPRGVFPKCDATEAQKASAAYFEERSSPEVSGNYSSFKEHSSLASLELARLEHEGHLQRIGTWEKIRNKWPKALATKLAVLVKEKPDKSLKVRFIVDMLRSGVNGLTKLSERIILPRGQDLVESILDLWEGRAHSQAEVEMLVVDIVDAFLNLKIAEEERAYAVVTNEDEYFAYSGVPFGLASAPLLWGRVAAWLGRAGQAVSEPDQLRMQVYVDDPILAAIGDMPSRDRAFARVILLWLALGVKLNWPKATLGTSVEWIGAEYSARKGTVTAKIPADRITKLTEKVEGHLAAKGMTSNLASLAGEMSWVAGIVPRLRPFVTMLYGAVHEAARRAESQDNGESRKRPKNMVFIRQVEFPLTWIKAFLEGACGSMQKTFHLADRHAPPTLTITTDASTSGLGAILSTPSGQPIAWMADLIRQEDRERFGAEPNDPAWMAEWELFAVLAALHVWQGRLRGHRLTCLMHVDSQAAIGAVAKLSSPSQVCNYISAEISLLLESCNVNLKLDHIRTEANLEADALSRLSEGKSVPRALRTIKATPPPERLKLFRVWPRK